MSTTRPNIVVVNPDQMRGDYLTPAGHPFIGTAHLERLARMGAYFPHAFCTTPMCGPSRTSFLTGRYGCEHGVRNYAGDLPQSAPNALANLRHAGYRTAIWGKDHVFAGDPVGPVYHEGENICIGNMDGHAAYRRSWDSGPLDPAHPGNLTERLTTAGLAFIDRQAGSGEPFFLTLNYQDPHPYFTAPEPYASMFSPDQFALPANFRREAPAGEIRRLTHWRQHSRSLEATDEDFRRAMAMYCGQIRYVDDQLGRVLDHLERKRLLDHTIVLFWSDHGEFVGDFGVTHKMPAFYESLLRVPGLLWDPTGRLDRSRANDLVEAPDLMATLLDLAGVPQPVGSRAQSLVAPNYRARESVFCEGGLYVRQPDHPFPDLQLRAPHGPTHWGPGAMVRTHTHKLCRHAFDLDEFFDLASDPHETTNRAGKGGATERALEEVLLRRLLCQGAEPHLLPEGGRPRSM